MSLHDFERVQERLTSVADPVRFLVNLFAHAPVGFAVWTADGHALLTNGAFMDLFGVEPPPEYNVLEDAVLEKNGMLALFKRAFAGETVRVPTFWYDPRELKVITVREGRRVAISMTIFPLFKASGEIDYVAATYKDDTEITLAQERLNFDVAERKKAEEEVRRLNENLERVVQARTAALSISNRELEAFSYSVAHDLRAPLRGINGFASILLEDHADKVDAEGRECLQRINENALLMAQLIDALLSLSQVTRSELEPRPTDLSTLARSVVDRIAAAEPERAVETAVEDGLHAQIDRTLARTLLENLLANAWKFTRRTPAPKIEIGAAVIDGAPTFFVRDNGAGFDMAHAGKLFAPFQRLHPVRDFPGTGVGLATAHRIVDRHGGRIWAEGKVGEGATFFFTLPPAESARLS
jgi:signal transduction histidine kinase